MLKLCFYAWIYVNMYFFIIKKQGVFSYKKTKKYKKHGGNKNLHLTKTNLNTCNIYNECEGVELGI